MKAETGWEAVRTAFRCGRELQQLLAVLKADCDPHEYRAFSVGIARAIDTINVELIDRSIARHPELRSRLEAELARDGRVG